MNVILVTIDCLRRDRCSVYGHHRDTTPALGALASDGFVFDRAYATGPATTESFPGILAGRLSAQCVAGQHMYQKALPDGASTIASHLCDRGWSTVGVLSNPRIGSHVDSNRGFETFRHLRSPGDASSGDNEGASRSWVPDIEVGKRLYQLRDRMRAFDSLSLRYELPFLAFRYYQEFTGWPSVRGEVVVDEFLETLSGESEPFFGWTHLMDVHGPLDPRVVGEGGLSNDSRLSQFRSHARRVSNVYDPRTEARYDSAVRYVDQQVQRIVDWLQNEGLWEETALIVTADHGDALGDRGIYGHPQHYMYDELLGVPLIVRVPDREGSRIKGPFSLGWLHELVAEIWGVDTMDAPVTSSRANLLSDGAAEDVVFADSVRDRGHSVAAWRADEKFVIQTRKLSGATETAIGPQGHYDLATDPTERQDSDDGVDMLEAAAHEIVVDPATLRNSEYSSGIDAETEDQLKQLGYAE